MPGGTCHRVTPACPPPGRRPYSHSIEPARTHEPLHPTQPNPTQPNRAFCHLSPGKGRQVEIREGKSNSPWAWLLRARRCLSPNCCSSSLLRSSPPLPSLGRPGRTSSTSAATSPPSPGVPLVTLCPLISELVLCRGFLACCVSVIRVLHIPIALLVRLGLRHRDFGGVLRLAGTGEDH